MNRNLKIIASATAASLMAFSALAQEAPNTKKGGTEITWEGSISPTRTVNLGRVEKASDIIGMEVQNYEGQRLGKVDDLAVDLETGRIVQVVLSTGGSLGFFAMLVPVPPGALRHDGSNSFVQLKADKAKLKAAPSYGMSNWADLGQSNQVAEVYRYHGQEPYFAALYQSTLGPDPTARLGYVQRATKLMGVSVMNVQKDTLGKVENLMVDLWAGRVVAVILSSGGFLGVGEALLAVPSAAFQFNSEQRYLQLAVSKEALNKAPQFKANEWPDLGEPAYAGRIYRAFRVEPYFVTNATVVADNTGRNVRDRNPSTLTPLDQGNSKADVDTTAQIRRGIIAGKNMSVNARNVKIITNKGQVTLRGPVNNADEKRLIGEIAINIAQSENVDNQLEVK